MYLLYNKVSCIYCQEEYSIKGIYTHYHIAHTKKGKEKHLKNSQKSCISAGNATKNKFKKLYDSNPLYCKNCDSKIPQIKRNNKFCSQSCAASYNNKTAPKRKKAPNSLCSYCGKETNGPKAKFCSTKCSGLSRRTSQEVKRAKNAASQAAYRARHGYLRAYAPDANKEQIKKIYANCPEGHEVDHIIPLSKGGKHHEDNLQYLPIVENRRKGNKILQ
jgi:5-methylcytosine-specific restriction endonuclease McrA